MSSDPKKAFLYNYSIGLEDVDAGGTLFFARAFTMAHRAYESYVSALGVGWDTWFQNLRFAILIRQANAEFLRPLRAGEAVTVSVAIGRVGDTSFQIEYHVRRGEEVCARISTVHVFVDLKTRAAMKLPVELRQFLLDPN